LFLTLKKNKTVPKSLSKDDSRAILIEKQLKDLLAQVLEGEKCPQTAIF
jgi:hypothetical protein